MRIRRAILRLSAVAVAVGSSLSAAGAEEMAPASFYDVMPLGDSITWGIYREERNARDG